LPYWPTISARTRSCEATDYPHQDGFFPGVPQMIRERMGPLSTEARYQVLAGGVMGFYGMQ